MPVHPSPRVTDVDFRRNSVGQKPADGLAARGRLAVDLAPSVACRSTELMVYTEGLLIARLAGIGKSVAFSVLEGTVY